MTCIVRVQCTCILILIGACNGGPSTIASCDQAEARVADGEYVVIQTTTVGPVVVPQAVAQFNVKGCSLSSFRWVDSQGGIHAIEASNFLSSEISFFEHQGQELILIGVDFIDPAVSQVNAITAIVSGAPVFDESETVIRIVGPTLFMFFSTAPAFAPAFVDNLLIPVYVIAN